MAGLRRLGKRLLEGWMRIVVHFGEVQTLVLLGLCYTLVVGPVGLGASLARRDFLGRRGLFESGSAFQEADSTPPDLERSKHPF